MLPAIHSRPALLAAGAARTEAQECYMQETETEGLET